MIEKITLDILTQDSVSVETQRYFNDNGIFYTLGQPRRKAYSNSIRGREDVKNELQQEQQNAIFMIWGEEPTVTEIIEE